MRPRNGTVLIGVDLVTVTRADGETAAVPDLGPGIREYIHGPRSGVYTVAWNEHHLCMKKLGTWNGKLWFIAYGSPKIVQGLSHLGANVRRPRDLTPAQRQQLLDLGVEPIRRKSDDAIVGIKPFTTFGENPISAGLGDSYDPSEEYY